MEKDTNNPIKILTDALATMTARATFAERERDEANARSLEWYKKWEQKDKEAKEVSVALADEIRGHKKTKEELEEAYRAVNVLNKKVSALEKPKNPTESR